MAPIPEVGEHNEKILAELGYEDVETTAPGRDVSEGGIMIGDDRHATRGGQMVWRSLLSVPGSNLRMVEEAFASDAIILDLEDAVAPEAKAGARRNVVRGLMEFDRRGKELCAASTPSTPPTSTAT
jgi:hypothetical protein